MEEGTQSTAYILAVIDSLKKQVIDERFKSIENKMEGNKQNLWKITNQFYHTSNLRKNAIVGSSVKDSDLLTKGQQDAICALRNIELSDGDPNHINSPKKSSRPIKLPKVQKLPHYSTWVFLDRNQRMAEDQSFVGRRRIYYDQSSGETLFCFDSEEENEDDEEMKGFRQVEDFLIRMTIQKLGMSDIVLDSLSQCLDRKPSDIKARCETIVKKDMNDEPLKCGTRDVTVEETLSDEHLDASVHSFDKLFCRQCLIFYCRLHGWPQEVMFPVDRQLPWSNSNEVAPCGIHCYQKELIQGNNAIVNSQMRQELAQSYGSAEENLSAKKGSTLKENFCTVEVTVQNNLNCDVVMESSETVCATRRDLVDDNVYTQENISDKKWKVLEKRLFHKGLEIFGKKSCLIARNLMSGMKTCSEIFQYMDFLGINRMDGKEYGSNTSTEIQKKVDNGKTMHLRYHSFRKTIIEKKDQPRLQYNPCGCKSLCGKQCSCLLNGTFCEKYCGCPKICKYRFRGCHCVKNQCRNRHCPCFDAGRECDPDICKNCWIGCGDGTLGVMSQRSEDYNCMNMNLFLKKQQRVLLGRSDVSGWGVFLKNSVGKNEFLGELTGELISHKEADRRGKIYDHENSSFLFNINDQFVLDAYRRGNKLKFVNHSRAPNCYTKVIMVAGEHKVGVFAKEPIAAGEEIFYDYHYDAHSAPSWAMKTESSGSKRKIITSSSGRARIKAKLQD